MAKSPLLICAALAGLVICACTLPTGGVAIKANPRMSAPGSIDFSQKIAGAIKDSFSDGEGGDMKVYDCIKVLSPKPYTFLIRISLFENTLESIYGQSGAIIPENTPLTPDVPLEPIQLSKLNDFLEGFSFAAIQSRLYISGDPIVTKLKMELNDGTGTVNELINNIDNRTSNLDSSRSDYEGTQLPAGGHEIQNFDDLLNSRGELQFSCKIITKEAIPVNEVSGSIKAELLIWLPLAFKAGDTGDGGAVITFPGMFETGEDLFKRKKGDESMLDMLRSIRLEVKLNGDAFKGGTMRITGITGCPLESQSIVLDLKGPDMEYVQKTVPFAPDVGIWFPFGHTLTISRGLATTNVTFSAEIDYRIKP